MLVLNTGATRVVMQKGLLLQEVSIKERQAQFTDASGETVRVDYDLLVGADGVDSKVRCLMRQPLLGLNIKHTWFHSST